MKRKQETFYSKVLLFGEYSVICGSKALTIPYTHFQGELSLVNENKYTDLDFAKESNEHLKKFFIHIKNLILEDKLNFDFNIKAFEQDIENGMYFESSIPQGYGVGSSGALVASIYRNYVPANHFRRSLLTPAEIAKTKKRLAQLESYFHGTSSGLDPLNSYLKQPLLIKNSSEIQTVDIPRRKFDENEAIFLFNSGKPGKTEPLVNFFMDSCENNKFKSVITDEYMPLNDNCINSIIKGESQVFFDNLKKLSQYQLQYFVPMIPKNIHTLWREGLENDNFTFKLCGSGGGGFIIGFTRNWEKLKKDFSKRNIKIIPVYKH